MSRNRAVLLVACLASGATACRTSGTVTGSLDAAADSASTEGDAAIEDGACPADPPSADASCILRGLWCEYDGGAHGRCSSRAYCSGKPRSDVTAWQVQPPDPTCGPNSAACPTSYGAPADPTDAACPVTLGSCDYDAGRCACATCDLDGGAGRMQWSCRAWGDVPAFDPDGGPSADRSACPADRPALGTPCSAPSIECGYDSCGGVSLGPYLACDQRRWGIGAQTDTCNSPACR